MDNADVNKVERYREIISDLIRTRAAYKLAHGVSRTEAIIDVANDHYEVMRVGWHGQRRIHGCVIHLDIIEGKVWVQYDGTDEPVVDALLEAGVPKEDIVLGFQPAEVRPLTEFAVA